MIDQLNRFWVAIPITYALTFWGLTAGFRRAGVPVERRLFRAMGLSVPVMVAALIAWAIIINVFEGATGSRQFPGLNTLLAFIFVPCSSALTGVVLARRNPTSSVERGTLLADEMDQDPIETGSLTLGGRPIAPIDETKHFKIMGTTGTGKSTAIQELLSGALARGDRAIIADPDGTISSVSTIRVAVTSS